MEDQEQDEMENNEFMELDSESDEQVFQLLLFSFNGVIVYARNFQWRIKSDIKATLFTNIFF